MIQQHAEIIGRLIRMSVEGVTFDRIQLMAVNLSPTTDRAQALALIHQLLDEQKKFDQIQSMLRNDLVFRLQAMRDDATSASVLRPMIYLSVARMIDYHHLLCTALAQQNMPGERSILGASFPYVSRGSGNLTPMTPRFSRFADITSDYQFTETYFRTEFRVTAARRMTAISVAANLYRNDHHHWPSDLKALVPNYLPAIPDDPFYANPHQIGYVFINPNRPMLFFDESGQPSQSAPTTQPDFDNWNPPGSRQWLDISNWWQSPQSKSN